MDDGMKPTYQASKIQSNKYFWLIFKLLIMNTEKTKYFVSKVCLELERIIGKFKNM